MTTCPYYSNQHFSALLLPGSIAPHIATHMPIRSISRRSAKTPTYDAKIGFFGWFKLISFLSSNKIRTDNAQTKTAKHQLYSQVDSADLPYMYQHTHRRTITVQKVNIFNPEVVTQYRSKIKITCFIYIKQLVIKQNIPWRVPCI